MKPTVRVTMPVSRFTCAARSMLKLGPDAGRPPQPETFARDERRSPLRAVNHLDWVEARRERLRTGAPEERDHKAEREPAKRDHLDWMRDRLERQRPRRVDREPDRER